MTYTPLFDRIVVRPTVKMPSSADTLDIAEDVNDAPMGGIVLALGHTCEGKVPMLQCGDHVLFPAWAASPFTQEGETLLILRLEDVLLHASKELPCP